MSIKASRVMTTRVATASPGDCVVDLAKCLEDHGIHAMPVSEGTGELVGMISERDLLGSFGRAHHMGRSWWLRLLQADDTLMKSLGCYAKLDNRVRDLMSPAVHAQENTSLNEVARIMMRHGTDQVPILRSGRVIGIVSRSDLVRALAQGAGETEDDLRRTRAGGNSPLGNE
jgi:CBS domain-containing protein